MRSEKRKKRWAGAELNRRHEDFQSSALPTELPARIKDFNYLRNCFGGLPRHVCTLWESCSRVFIDERRRRGKHHFLDVLLTWVVIALKDGKGLMASDRHNPLIVPPFPNLPRHEGMPQVMKVTEFF